MTVAADETSAERAMLFKVLQALVPIYEHEVRLGVAASALKTS